MCCKAYVTHFGYINGGKGYMVTEKSLFGLKIPAFS
jgi:hypothetical protein